MRCFVLVMILAITAPAFADKPSLFIRRDAPEAPKSQDSQNTRSKIYVTPRATLQNRSLNERASVVLLPTVTDSSVVFRNNFDAYRNIERSIVDKIYAFSPPPANTDDMMKIAAYKNIGKVEKMLEMQKALNHSAPAPRIDDGSTITTISAFRAPIENKKTVPLVTKRKKAIYNRKDTGAQSRTWKLWGNNR